MELCRLSEIMRHTSHSCFTLKKEPGTGQNKIGAKSESNDGTTILINRIGNERIPFHSRPRLDTSVET